MADEYDYDDGDMFEDDGWLYLEEDDALADELAETQIADPGYAGTNYDLELEHFDYDEYFGYWDDLQYGDDSYWDMDGRAQLKQEVRKAGEKRKRGVKSKTAFADKRRKVSAMQSSAVERAEAGLINNVVFASRRERSRPAQPPVLQKRSPVSFLGDWRERYANEDGVVSTERMPVEMQQAAQGVEDTPTKARLVNAAGNEGEGAEEDWEDVKDISDDDGADPFDLDPDVLKDMLKQKLASSGLGDQFGGAFMDTLQRMLAGDEDAAAGELANTLLGQAGSEGGHDALSGWLSQQGVSMNAAEEADDASSVATAEPTEGSLLASRRGRTQQRSPTDSGVTPPESSRHGTKEIAVRGGSPEAAKKEASSANATQEKGKEVNLDIPPSQSSQATQAPRHEESRSQESLHEADLPSPGSTVSEVAARANRKKAADAALTGRKKSSATIGRATPSEQLQVELQDDADTKVAAEKSLRQTRKRKASAPADDEVGKEEVRGRAVKEPTTRSTRSARAQVGKR